MTRMCRGACPSLFISFVVALIFGSTAPIARADDAATMAQAVAKAKLLQKMIAKAQVDQNLKDVAESLVVGAERYRDVLDAGGEGAAAKKAERYRSFGAACERAKRELKVLKELMPEALALLAQVCALYDDLDRPEQQIDDDDPPNGGPGYDKPCVLQCLDDILACIAALQTQAEQDSDGSPEYGKLAAELDELKPIVKNMKSMVKDDVKRSLVYKEYKKARDHARNIAGIKDGASFTPAVCQAWDALLNGMIQLENLLKPQQSQASSQPRQASLIEQSQGLVVETEKVAAALAEKQGDSSLNDARAKVAALASSLIVLRDRANGADPAAIRKAYDDAKAAHDKAAPVLNAAATGNGPAVLPKDLLAPVTKRLEEFRKSLP